MSWSNLKELIFQERKALESAVAVEFPQDSPFESQHSALLACYLRTKEQVDTAVHYFAQTLEWPELSPIERFFVVARLDFAWEIVSILNTGQSGDPLIAFPSPERSNTEGLLELLLLDIWPYGCGRFLQAQKWIAEQPSVPQMRPGVLRQETARVKCVA